MTEEGPRATTGRTLERILVVDDHKTFTDLVRMALDAEPDLTCVGAAHTVAQARSMVEQHPPDVVLMDVNLKAEDGLDLASEIMASHPELRVVVLTAHADRQVMSRAARAGACALLPKDGSLPELLESLRAARSGEFRVQPALLHDIVVEGRTSEPATTPAVQLTPREGRVLELLAQGVDVRTIARELTISVHTCRGYVKAVLAKLGAHSQLEAVAAARAQGLLHEDRA